MSANASDGVMSAPINEAVSLLDKLSPERLKTLREEFPDLSPKLKLGITAGSEGFIEKTNEFISEKAQIMIAALSEAESAANKAASATSRRISSARLQRLFAQLLVLLGSSSSLAALAFGQHAATIVCAVLTLVAAVGNLVAEYKEKLLNPQSGNIYDAYQRLREGAYKARTLSSDLELAIKYKQPDSELETLISKANVLCEELNGWLVQMLADQPS